VHRRATLTVFGRRLLVERIELEGWPIAHAAAMTGVIRQTATKRVRRYGAGGLAGLAAPSYKTFSGSPAARLCQPTGTFGSSSDAISRAQASIASHSRKSPAGRICFDAGIRRTTRSSIDFAGSIGSKAP
jgi:hypothetical protein